MTIPELAEEYSRSAQLLHGRIAELRQEMKETEDEELRLRLDRRIRPLQIMLRETRQTARYLADYYGRGGRKE
jgi:hypothetical protein